jgi:hypothetical protein
MGMVLWLSFDSAHRINRIMYTTITLWMVVTYLFSIYCYLLVWQNNAVLADLNGAGVPGTVTRFYIQQMCCINLLVLIGGSLFTLLKKNWSDNTYFHVCDGYVLRREIIEIMELGSRTEPDGAADLNMHNTLECRLKRHWSDFKCNTSVTHRQEL